jgi:Holliday junction resolvase RusA-like endonuclease
MIKITIDKKTPSVNHLYGHNRLGHFYLKKEGRELREYISNKIKNTISKEKLEQFKNIQLIVSVNIFENWFTKKGTVRRIDIANREKFLIDSVFNALGLDDCFIFEHVMRKVQSEYEKAVITIQQLF